MPPDKPAYNQPAKKAALLERDTEDSRHTLRQLKSLEKKYSGSLRGGSQLERILSVLLHIAQSTIKVDNLQELLAIIHKEVGTLFEARNFDVSLYNEESSLYYFTYSVDENQEVALAPLKLKNSLTDYVRRSDRKLLVDDKKRRELIEKGEISQSGTPSALWMGAPLKTARGVIGVVAVQSHTDPEAYSGSDLELLSFVSGHIAMAIERKHSEELIVQAKQQWERTVDAVPELIALIDDKFRIVRLNRTMASRLGLEPHQCIGKTCFSVIHKKETPPDSCPYRKMLADGREHSVEIHVENLDGDFIVTTSPLFDAEKQQMLCLHVARDVTKQKRAEQQIKTSLKEKEVLLSEIHHRVKNNMQIISSLLSLQAQRIKNKRYRKMFNESHSRIQAMALIHETLYRSESFARIEFSKYLATLCSNLSSLYLSGRRTIEIDIDTSGISLEMECSVPCGLILNELVSNCLKHAFPARRAGKVSITMRETGKGTIELKVHDNGIGIPESLDWKNADSLGLKIVSLLAEHQLEGTVDLSRSGGTEFIITFER
ncbi:MAG: histidine kinase dimerization/phosphoacceptor domain -containing protein [Gemmatimonadota bacterium]|nr:histidine kinase dimerization/phosphoacceptor domain -containing protein [Gemmatimonadota bacterium]